MKHLVNPVERWDASHTEPARLQLRRKRSFTVFAERHTMTQSEYRTSDQRLTWLFSLINCLLLFTDSMWVVICATIGSTENASTSPKTNRKIYRNSFAANANTRVILKSCTVCVDSRTTKHNSIFAATSVRTGSTVDVSAFCRARPKASTNTFVRIANATTQWILRIWKRWVRKSMII